MRRLLFIVVLIGAALASEHLPVEWTALGGSRAVGESAPPVRPATGDRNAGSAIAVEPAEIDRGRERILAAFRARESKVWVTSAGEVERTLSDDNEGSRHQRFIVDVGGHTVLLSHNIDLAPRVPLDRGDRVTFRGRYEWNDRGGVVHWTHHDPRGRKAGGWVAHRGERYR